MARTVEQLEELVSELNGELDVAQEERDEMEKYRDRAVEREREAKDHINREKRDILDLLRRLEFPDGGRCLICRRFWAVQGFSKPTHAPGCELRIKIMEIETSMVKQLVIED